MLSTLERPPAFAAARWRGALVHSEAMAVATAIASSPAARLERPNLPRLDSLSEELKLATVSLPCRLCYRSDPLRLAT